MQEILGSFLLVVSLGGILFVVGSKIPVLLQFPAKEEGNSIRAILARVRSRFESSSTLRPFSSPELLLQTMLSKSWIFALRVERMISQWLERVRKNTQEKKAMFSDTYWQQLKKGKGKKRVS